MICGANAYWLIQVRPRELNHDQTKFCEVVVPHGTDLLATIASVQMQHIATVSECTIEARLCSVSASVHSLQVNYYKFSSDYGRILRLLHNLICTVMPFCNTCQVHTSFRHQKQQSEIYGVARLACDTTSLTIIYRSEQGPKWSYKE